MAEQGEVEVIELGRPISELRWRIHEKKLPMQKRHLRTLPVLGYTDALAGWVQQHVEWTLEKTAHDPDGVLITTVYEDGKALMRIDPYVPPTPRSADEMVALFSPVKNTDVASEALWLAHDGGLVLIDEPSRMRSAANSLFMDLARTLGITCRVEAVTPDWLDVADEDTEVFVVSDEHGVVGSTDRSGKMVEQFGSYYEKLMSSLES